MILLRVCRIISRREVSEVEIGGRKLGHVGVFVAVIDLAKF
jgi:hypothetical protein